MMYVRKIFSINILFGKAKNNEINLKLVYTQMKNKNLENLYKLSPFCLN